METAPRNCRFLSLVVVELVLTKAWMIGAFSGSMVVFSSLVRTNQPAPRQMAAKVVALMGLGKSPCLASHPPVNSTSSAPPKCIVSNRREWRDISSPPDFALTARQKTLFFFCGLAWGFGVEKLRTGEILKNVVAKFGLKIRNIREIFSVRSLILPDL